jgi:hypothetical protein
MVPALVRQNVLSCSVITENFYASGYTEPVNRILLSSYITIIHSNIQIFADV